MPPLRSEPRPPGTGSPAATRKWADHGASDLPAPTADPPATTAGACGAAVPSAASALHRRLCEPVADTEDGLQVARRAGLGFDLAADVLDVRVNRAFIGLEGHAPHRVQQLPARENATRLAGQGCKQLEFGLGQIHRPSTELRLHARDVQLDVRADTDDL